jgi:phosphoribosyl-ATP pyrophosphohydrolase/phosphoribosyl-AMP cyclohydrolase
VKVFGALKDVKFDERGLVPVIVQDALSGAVLSLVYANMEALERTVESGLVWRYSRARKELMQKGATSGNTQEVLSLRTDCDNDAVLARVLPKGPACHSGEYSCFGSSVPGAWAGPDERVASRRAYPGGVYALNLEEADSLGDEVDRMLGIK